jgi:hypothetical protein
VAPGSSGKHFKLSHFGQCAFPHLGALQLGLNRDILSARHLGGIADDCRSRKLHRE